MGPWCPTPIKQKAIGLSSGWALLLAVWWHGRTFNIFRMLWHRLSHPSTWWANSIQPESAYASTTVTRNGSCKFPNGLLSWHSLLPRGLSTLGTGRRSLLCTRHPLSGRNVQPRPSIFLQPPYRQVMCHPLNKKLSVWSTCSLSLFPALRRHLSRVRVEQKKVPYWGCACVLLMRLWQDGRLTHFLPWGFEQTWPETRPPVSLLASGVSSFFPLSIRSHYSPDSWPPENRSTQPHLYFTSLLVVGKSRRTIHLISSPSRERSTMPTPPACLLNDLSMWILH